MIKTDVAIIGGGIAGLSAAMYSRRFDLDVTVFDPFIGGTIVKTDHVGNYPGFNYITGQKLADKVKEHAMAYYPKIINEMVDELKKDKDCFIITSGKEKYQARAIILATGTEWKKLNVPGEKEFENKGVHYCAVCDGFFYKDKIVAMIGAGDSAAKDAMVLSGIAKKVYLIVRGEDIHPEPINYRRVKEAKNIEIINKTNVLEIIGENKVNKLRLDKSYKGSKELPVNGVFIDIGHAPLTEIAKHLGVKLNKKGEIITNKLTETNVKGFFAAGDVSDTPFKQAITGASEGSIAAYAAYDYITKNPLCTYDDKPVK
jgi:thioredoxin reductase (NADPH)